MKNSEYYYGKNYNAETLRDLHYPRALIRKNIWANELLEKLKEMPLYIDSDGVRYPIRDGLRIRKVSEAIADNNKLFNECYGKEIE